MIFQKKNSSFSCDFLVIFARKKSNLGLFKIFYTFAPHIDSNQTLNFMKKNKLIEMRNSKKIPQHQIAELMNMDASCYSRRENGEVYMKIEEWEKLAKILDVPLGEIYEADERQSNTCSDNASGNFIGTNFGPNNIYTTSELLIEMLQKHNETQQKYITKLEEENRELKKLVGKM